MTAVGGIAGRRAVRMVRRLVNRAGFDITREPFMYRFVRVLDRLEITSVLDIGANVGQYGRDLRDARFSGDIVSVEPLSDPFRGLAAAAASDAAWACERVAVSDAPGTLTINISGNSVSSSALPMLGLHADSVPTSRYVATEEVTATTVDDVVARHGLTPSSTLLKIDVQGYEATVLDGARATLAQFAAVQLELSLAPLYEGQKLMPDMVARMDAQGFDLWLVEPAFMDPATGRMLQCDGFFVRR